MAALQRHGHRRRRPHQRARDRRQRRRRHGCAKFAEIDGNRDGYLVRSELRAYHAAHASAARGRTCQARRWSDFAAADLNRDGKLSRVEVSEKMPRLDAGFRLDGRKPRRLPQPRGTAPEALNIAATAAGTAVPASDATRALLLVVPGESAERLRWRAGSALHRHVLERLHHLPAAVRELHRQRLVVAVAVVGGRR